jgi:3-isopropylmalate/(R)-2-methylmalate dehydratase large subunit
MEGRMTLCNMSIEGGARAGLVAPDEKAFAYLNGRPKAPKGAAWDAACAIGKTLYTDEGAISTASLARRQQPAADRLLGHQPRGRDLGRRHGARPALIEDETKRSSKQRALDYMGLTAGTKMVDIPLDVIWIGSCTNGRIEDLRAVAKIVEGKKIAGSLDYAMIVPGSGLVKQQAEQEGLDKIFLAAGFEWREPGCSMCLAMNPDILSDEAVDELFKQVEADPGYQLQIDLQAQTVTRPDGKVLSFEIDAFRKHCLLKGLDDIGLTLLEGEAIGAFEVKHRASQPWLFEALMN